MDVSNFTGSISDYNNIVAMLRRDKINEMRKEMLMTPSHHRPKIFGTDLLKMCNVNYTTYRRIYA